MISKSTIICRQLIKNFRVHILEISLSLLQAVDPSGEGVSHTGSLSPFSSILGILHVELQVLHIVLDDVDPSLSRSSSAPVCVWYTYWKSSSSKVRVG